MRVLVCGGRDYTNKDAVYDALTFLSVHEDLHIIAGGARGADAFGAQWALDHDMPLNVYNADWETHGKSAGPIRNQQMLDEGKPDLVLAFPGGRGTNHMKRIARKAGVEVVEVYE